MKESGSVCGGPTLGVTNPQCDEPRFRTSVERFEHWTVGEHAPLVTLVLLAPAAPTTAAEACRSPIAHGFEYLDVLRLRTDGQLLFLQSFRGNVLSWRTASLWHLRYTLQGLQGSTVIPG